MILAGEMRILPSFASTQSHTKRLWTPPCRTQPKRRLDRTGKPKGHIATRVSLSPTVGSDLVELVTERLNGIVEEETGRKLGELNIVTEVSEISSGSVRVRFRPLAAYSPLAVDIGRSIRNAALAVDGVREVRVECNGHMMDDLVNKIVNRAS